MASVKMSRQTAPTTPASGSSVLWADSLTKRQLQTDDAGHHYGSVSPQNMLMQLVQNPFDFTADSPLFRSDLAIPSYGLQAGMCFLWRITAQKTSAGTATPVINVRVGRHRTVLVDSSRMTLTMNAAQTAANESGILTVMVSIRSTGASGVWAGAAAWSKLLASTAGLGGNIDNVASSWNMNGARGYVWLSINAGASSVWTIHNVVAELIG